MNADGAVWQISGPPLGDVKRIEGKMAGPADILRFSEPTREKAQAMSNWA